MGGAGRTFVKLRRKMCPPSGAPPPEDCPQASHQLAAPRSLGIPRQEVKQLSDDSVFLHLVIIVDVKFSRR